MVALKYPKIAEVLCREQNTGQTKLSLNQRWTTCKCAY